MPPQIVHPQKRRHHILGERVQHEHLRQGGPHPQLSPGEPTQSAHAVIPGLPPLAWSRRYSSGVPVYLIVPVNPRQASPSDCQVRVTSQAGVCLLSASCAQCDANNPIRVHIRRVLDPGTLYQQIRSSNCRKQAPESPSVISGRGLCTLYSSSSVTGVTVATAPGLDAGAGALRCSRRTRASAEQSIFGFSQPLRPPFTKLRSPGEQAYAVLSNDLTSEAQGTTCMQMLSSDKGIASCYYLAHTVITAACDVRVHASPGNSSLWHLSLSPICFCLMSNTMTPTVRCCFLNQRLRLHCTHPQRSQRSHTA